MGILDGKVALITGAAGGQGAAEARLFAAEGARIVLTDLDGAGASLAAEIGDAALFMEHDVGDAEQWHRVVEAAMGRFGRLDILVNNAAIYHPRGILDTDPASFDLHYRVNQRGPFLGIRAVAPAMRSGGGGAIVNIASGLGTIGSPGVFAYSATKWALRGIGKCAAKDLAPFNIRVNTVLPGLVGTKMVDVNPPEVMQALIAQTPMKRVGEAEEIARVVAFLASDAASFMTGAEVAVDGGLAT